MSQSVKVYGWAALIGLLIVGAVGIILAVT